MDSEGLESLYPSLKRALGIIDHLHLIEPSALPKALETLKDSIIDLADSANTSKVIAMGAELRLNKALEALRLSSGLPIEDGAHVIPEAFRGLAPTRRRPSCY